MKWWKFSPAASANLSGILYFTKLPFDVQRWLLPMDLQMGNNAYYLWRQCIIWGIFQLQSNRTTERMSQRFAVGTFIANCNWCIMRSRCVCLVDFMEITLDYGQFYCVFQLLTVSRHRVLALARKSFPEKLHWQSCCNEWLSLLNVCLVEPMTVESCMQMAMRTKGPAQVVFRAVRESSRATMHSPGFSSAKKRVNEN